MPGDPLRLYYDGRCGMCRRFRRLVELLDRRDRVEPVPLQDAHEEGNLLGLDEEDFWAQFHLEEPDGTVLSGADAVAPLVDALAGGSGPAWLVRHVPPARWLVRGLYTAALRRHGGPAEPWDGDQG